MSEDIETLTIKEREDIDLTDKIWNVLKKVDSFAQLCDSWKYLFQMIKRDDIKPYVRSKNDTDRYTEGQKILKNRRQKNREIK